MASNSLTFTFWTPPPKDPDGLLDADDRRKIAENVFRFDTPLVGARIILREVHRKYGVRRVSDIPRARLRSVLLMTARWCNDLELARYYGDPQGIVNRGDMARLRREGQARHVDRGEEFRQHRRQ